MISLEVKVKRKKKALYSNFNKEYDYLLQLHKLYNE